MFFSIVSTVCLSTSSIDFWRHRDDVAAVVFFWAVNLWFSFHELSSHGRWLALSHDSKQAVIVSFWCMSQDDVMPQLMCRYRVNDSAIWLSQLPTTNKKLISASPLASHRRPRWGNITESVPSLDKSHVPQSLPTDVSLALQMEMSAYLLLHSMYILDISTEVLC